MEQKIVKRKLWRNKVDVRKLQSGSRREKRKNYVAWLVSLCPWYKALEATSIYFSKFSLCYK